MALLIQKILKQVKSDIKIFLFTRNCNVKIYSVNPLYLIFRYVNGYFEKINGNKQLTPAPANESKEKILKNQELQIKTRNLIRSIIRNSDDYHYDEKYIKIKSDSNDELPLNKTIELVTITIEVRAVFLKITNTIHNLSQMNVCIKHK